MSAIATRLTDAGLSPSEAAGKATLFEAAERALPSADNAMRWFVPGRIEVAGKHTDYAGGRSLLCTAERGMCVVAAPRKDSVVRVLDVVRQESVEFAWSSDIPATAGWTNYVRTVIARLARNFPGPAQGADVAIASDLPAAAGMSSSSVLVVGMFTALAEINCLRERDEFSVIACPEHLAEYLGCIENGETYCGLEGDAGVGTFGGSEDHTAILCSQAGQLARYRFRPVTLEARVSMPADWVFVIGMSGVRASKTGAARDQYNRASRAARAVLEVWNQYSRSECCSLYQALHSGSQDPADAADEIHAALRPSQHDDFSNEELQARFDQWLFESEIVVPAAAAAFASGDAQTLGEIMDRSQWAAERLLQNQIPETSSLAQSARRLGAIAASAFGAGFGGSVWAIVPRPEAAEFMDAWRTEYAQEFPEVANQAEFFITSAGPGLTQV